MQRGFFAQKIYHERMIIMEFKKTVAGISAAAIAVTQVAAVIPMNTFAATEDVASANVQFALNYKAGGKTNSVTAAASEKTATVNADDIASVEDFGLSFSGAITGADLADGDKYTFTANGLTVTAKEKDTKSVDTTGTVWVEADGVDLDGTTAAGKLDVENAGAVGDTVTIAYTKADTDIKVVDSNGVDIANTASEEGKFTFVLTADSASKFTISGDGVTVGSVKVTKKTETQLSIGNRALTTEIGDQTVTATGGVAGDEVTVTFYETPDFGGVGSLTIAGVDAANNGSPYTFELTEDMVTNGFTVSGNAYTISEIKLVHTEEADLNKSGEIKDTKTPATVTVAADKFADVALVDGSTLTVGTAKTGENDGTITIKAGDVVITEGTAPAESYTLNAEQAAAVKANGLTITGSGIKLAKVDYRVKGETTKGQTITLFSGSDSVVWSETYASETQTWETLVEDTAKTTVSTDKLTLGTLEAFKDKYENITATWSELTAVKVTPDAPTEVQGTLPFSTETDLSKNYIKFGAVADAAKDGTITVGVKDTDGAAVVLKDADGNKLDEKAVTSDATSVVFTLTEEQAAKVAQGFIIAGTKGTVTSVAYKAKAEETDPVDKDTVEIWKGEFDLGEWTNNFTELPAYSKAEKNGTFTINYTVNDGAEYAQLMLTDKGSEANSWKWTDLTEAENLVIPSTNHSYTLTDTIADSIKNGRIVIKGANVTLTSVTYKAPASSGEDKKETVLFEGSTDMGTKWGKNEPIAKFNAVKGGTITAEFEEGSTEYWQLKFMDSSWEVLSSPKTNQWGSVELGANATKYSFDLNAADAKAVSSNGMIVSGYGITLKKLTYTAPTGEVEEDKLAINAANFPDANFRKVLTAYSSEKVKNVPVLTEADIAKITDLGNEKTDGSKVEAENLAKVVNFKGIEKLTALKSLTLTNTQRNFKALDLSENAALTFVDVSGCTNLADLKLPETAAIETLLLQKTAITAVDVSKYTGLKVLNVSDTKLTALDVKANTELETLALANVKVAELDVKANTKLRTLDAANCGLTKIDVSANTLLEDLDVSGNSLITLDLTGLTALTADKFKADNNKRNIGTVIDGEYDLKDLVAEGLVVDNMTITTEGVTRNKNVLTGVKGDVTYTYETGLETEGLDKVTFTLAPEKVTSFNFYVSANGSNPVVCETWNDVLNAMNDKTVDYTVMIAKDNVKVDALKFPTAAKAKSVTISSNNRDALTIITKSASVTLPTDVTLANVNINAVDKNGKQAKSFTLSASKNLTIDNLSINAEKAVIKGAAKSTLTIGGILPNRNVVADAEITGFGTVAVYDGCEVTFDKNVKVKDLRIGGGATAVFGSNNATFTNVITDNESTIKYNTADYNPVAVTGNISGENKLKVGISYEKSAASAEEGQDPVLETVTKFAKDDVVLVSKSANLAAVDASESLLEGATLGRDKSDIKVMDTVATMNGVKYAQWSDITSTIAAVAKADKNFAKTAVYNIALSKELDANGALKMPAAGTFGTLIIRSDADAQTLKFTGNLTLTGKTIFENVKLESDKIVNKVATAADFSISAGKNELTLNNVTTADKASIKTITSSGVVNLDRVTVGTVNAATVNVTKTTSIVPGAGAVNDAEKTWEGKEVAASSVTVNGNLTAKTALNLKGDNASLTVKGVVNAMSIEAEKETATLAVYTQPKGKNALVIGKNGVTAASKSLQFVLVDYTSGKTAHITEDVVLGTIAGTYADEFIPSNDNLDAEDSYYILKSGKNLIAKSKDAAADYVTVKINGKTARYKTVDEAIKEISATGKSTDVVEITITGTTFTGAIDKLPLPTAGKYKTLTYKAADAVAVKVTGDLALTGNLVLDNVDIEKVTKDGKSTAALNVNVGKYELYANGCYLNKTADAAEGSGEYSAVANISGTGKFTTGIDIVVSGKVNGITLVLQNSKVTLDGDKAAFTGSIEANRNCTFSYTNAKNVKFVNITGDSASSLKLDGAAVKENAVLAAITGDYTKDAVIADGFKVVRSGNSLKAVKAENVVEVKAYSSESDFEDENVDKVRAYDSVASAMNDISRIKNKEACYKVAVKTGDVLVLPKANTYRGIELTADKAAEITTARDLTLTGNLRLSDNITLNRADKKAMTVKLGSYALIIDENAHVAYDAEKKVSQFVNIDGSKGAFIADGDITVSGKVNVDHFKAPKTTLVDKASFTAANIIAEGGESLDYNVNIANKVKIGNIFGKGNIVLNVDGEIADKQIAVLTGNYVAESVTIGDGETYVAVPKGNKLMAVAKANAKAAALTLDGSTTYLFDTYENAVKAVAKLGDAQAEIEIDVTDVQPVSGKLTLPTNGKYKTLTITSDKAVTLKVNSDITLTGNLIIGGKVTLQKKEGTAKDLLKFKSATDRKTKKALYTVTVVDNAKVVNGTVNGEPIVNPEPTEPEPVQKETVNGTLPYSGDEVDLSAKVLKINKADVVRYGAITVTLKANVTSAIVLNNADGSELAKATPKAEATSVIFTLTAEQAEKITANGFTVTGDAGVVTGVKYMAPIPATEEKGEKIGTLDYSDSVDLTLYVLKINAKSDVAAKGTITVTLQDAVENSIEFRRTADGDALKTIAPTSGSNTYTWELSDEDAAYIKGKGFYISGTAGVITSVTYTEPKPAVTPGKKVAYQGSLNYNGDGIDLSRFLLQINKKAVVENGTITVTLKEEVTSSVIFKKTNQTDVIKTVAPTSGSTTYTWVLSADDAAYIAENGFVIDGTEGVLTSVTYTAPDSSDIDDNGSEDV